MSNDAYRASNPPLFDYSDTPTRSHYPPAAYVSADQFRPGSRETSRDRGEVRTSRDKHASAKPPLDGMTNSPIDASAANIHPDLIAQITHNVIQQLRTTPAGEGGTPLHASFPPPPPPPVQPIPSSPTRQSGASPPIGSRTTYTPPSPHKHSDHSVHESPESSFSAPISPREHQRERERDRDRDRERPSGRSDRESSTHSMHRFEHERPQSRASVSSQASTSAAARPRGPLRLSTAKEETTLEKIWGPLFDSEGRGTARLGQFLRGLAVHLIEDYEPMHSIVVTPVKMAKFYECNRLASELYTWDTIFDDELSSLSRMYRELECQHHLVQEEPDQRPDIPGLTPRGFQHWATLLIQAHPDEEFARLQKAVLEMPISNPDDKKERFPKDISRRLFPPNPALNTRSRIQRAMLNHTHITLPNMPSPALSHSPPRTARQYAAATPAAPAPSASPDLFSPPANTIERERKPYSSIPSECAIDDTNPITPKPVERERNPYQSGPDASRRHYTLDTSSATASRPPNTAIPASMMSSSTGFPHRSNSTTERSRPINLGPAPTGHHYAPRSSTSSASGMPGPPFPQPSSQPPNSARRHSPSFSASGIDPRRPSDGSQSYSTTAPFSMPMGASADTMSDGAIDDESAIPRRKYTRRQMAGEDYEAPGSARRFDREERSRERGTRERERERERAYAADEEFYRTRPRGGDGSAGGYGGQGYR